MIVYSRSLAAPEKQPYYYNTVNLSKLFYLFDRRNLLETMTNIILIDHPAIRVVFLNSKFIS